MSKESAFMALQCVECQTMQVKQQRRSGSKWICAVCNRRQSVLRVFARGPLPRDIRLFVQRFNMSRDRDLPQLAPVRPPPPAEGCRKRRTDRSEYLDPDSGEEEMDRAMRGEIGISRRVEAGEARASKWDAYLEGETQSHADGLRGNGNEEVHPDFL